MPAAAELDIRSFTREQAYTVMPLIDGSPNGKNFLSMHQLDTNDIHTYLNEAAVAKTLVDDEHRNGINLLPRVTLKAVMRQDSTRTAGSMADAMIKLGGNCVVISGMAGSSEGKGESLSDSWEAYATQSNILGVRTKEEYGSAFAAFTINRLYKYGKLKRKVPVINLGDGTNEHPTQAMGDLFTIKQALGRFEGLNITMVGDHERYRAFHSLMIGAATLGMTVTAVESEVSAVPQDLIDLLGSRLTRTRDLDAAMRKTNVLYVGRNPDEYEGEKGKDGNKIMDEAEEARSQALAKAYASWTIDYDRIETMDADAIVLHPRPRRTELHYSVDSNHRMWDVQEMDNMIPMRIVLAAGTRGLSIIEANRRYNQLHRRVLRTARHLLDSAA
jgi:aspartate carbamoyltransferase catalytic subunit